MAGVRDQFIEATFWHGSVERANEILAAHPELSSADIHIAAILGDDDAVRRFIADDPASATAKSGPRNVEPLIHLCFSAYLREDETRSEGFVRAATALLDAGADANAAFFDESHTPPERESVLYGAAGVAHHAGVTRLLLERGADPNDGEVPYHSPETDDNRAMKVLLDSGKLNENSLNMMLLRKTDWHDYDGLAMLLDYGVDPNKMTRWGKTALHNALLSDNGLKMIELLLDRGADPTIIAPRAGRGDPAFTNRSVVSIAARRGRADALRAFQAKGFSIELAGVERLIAACALDDAESIRSLTQSEPALVTELLADGATLLAEFAGTANAAGVARLLDLGVPIEARYKGDGYFGIAPDSTALHVAAWKAWQPVIELLIARGADVNAVDGKGNTPLMLAVRAATKSYWAWRRTPDGVKALLAAGASAKGVSIPTGYAEADTLLRGAR